MGLQKHVIGLPRLLLLLYFLPSIYNMPFYAFRIFPRPFYSFLFLTLCYTTKKHYYTWNNDCDIFSRLIQIRRLRSYIFIKLIKYSNFINWHTDNSFQLQPLGDFQLLFQVSKIRHISSDLFIWVRSKLIIVNFSNSEENLYCKMLFLTLLTDCFIIHYICYDEYTQQIAQAWDLNAGAEKL